MESVTDKNYYTFFLESLYVLLCTCFIFNKITKNEICPHSAYEDFFQCIPGKGNVIMWDPWSTLIQFRLVFIREMWRPQKYEPIDEGLKLTTCDGPWKWIQSRGWPLLSTAWWFNVHFLTCVLYNVKYNSVHYWFYVEVRGEVGKEKNRKSNRLDTELGDLRSLKMVVTAQSGKNHPVKAGHQLVAKTAWVGEIEQVWMWNSNKRVSFPSKRRLAWTRQCGSVPELSRGTFREGINLVENQSKGLLMWVGSTL